MKHSVKKIGFVTYTGKPEITKDDQLLANELENHGYEVVGLPWDSNEIDWQSFDRIIIRSCWNYHLNYKAFRAWLSKLSAINIETINGQDLVSWNMDKKYLFHL